MPGMRIYGVIAAALVLAGCGGATAPRGALPATTAGSNVTISGSVIVPDDAVGFDEMDARCSISSGYSDVGEGGTVTVTGPDGRVVGLGSVSPGKRISGGEYGSCELPITATAPAGLKFYGVAVGHRNPAQFAEADLSRPIVLTLS
jgi:hypothetical protein